MNTPIVIGGPLSGTRVHSTHVQVMRAERPARLYDRTGDTRPFVHDVEVRTLEARRLGIPVLVVLDDIPEAAAVDALQRIAPAVQEALLRELTSRAEPEPWELHP